VVQIGEVDRLAGALAGVRRTTAAGLAQWRYHGRLVARELDETHLVIRGRDRRRPRSGMAAAALR
jgi:hypothetical protein